MEAKKMPANMNQLDELLNTYFGKKAPALPVNIKEIIVQFAPWLVVLGLVLSIPGILSLLGSASWLSSMPMAYAYTPRLGYTLFVSAISLVINAVLMILALSGLFAKTKSGWNFIFYATIVNAVSSLLLMNIGSLIIGTLLSFYILYQIKPYYK